VKFESKPVFLNTDPVERRCQMNFDEVSEESTKERSTSKGNHHPVNDQVVTIYREKLKMYKTGITYGGTVTSRIYNGCIS